MKILRAVIYGGKDQPFMKGLLLVSQENDIIGDEHWTCEIKTLFNQSNLIVNVINLEKYISLNKL